MKKCLSVLLSLVLLLTFVPTGMIGATVSADGVDIIGAGEVWNGSWTSGTKRVYLMVEEEGFYDLKVEDLNRTGYLSMYGYNQDVEDDTLWYNPSFRIYGKLISEEGYVRNRLHLMAGKLYEISFRYEDDEENYLPANINICFSKSNYAPMQMTLGNNSNVIVGDETAEYMEFTTTKSGDYEVAVNQMFYGWVDIYEKESGAYLGAMDPSSHSLRLFNLKKNTAYMMVIYGYESNSMLVRASVTKTPSNVSKIEIAAMPSIWGTDCYQYNAKVYLSWSIVTSSSMLYKVTYADGTYVTGNREDLQSSYGIYIDDIIYTGAWQEYRETIYMGSHTQPVLIQYGAKTFASAIYVTSYLDWVANLNPTYDYKTMNIYYSDGESNTYYWKLRPDQSTLYDFYSSNWDSISTTFTIFDENNKVIPYVSESESHRGWKLKEGQEYSLCISYSYNEDYTNDVEFYLAPNRDHVHAYSYTCDTTCNECGGKRSASHSYKSTVSKKATLDTNGKKTSTCKYCGKEKTSTIYKPTSFKLSTTVYAYNGKVRNPKVTVKDSKGNTLKEGTDYTVTYESGRKKAGTYDVKIKMKGSYSGSKTLTFKILKDLSAPKSVTTKLYGHDDVKVSWKKVSGAKAYAVYYKKSSASKYTYLGRTTGTSYKKANLADGTKYTFKVVPCNYSGGKYYEDPSSKTSSIYTLKAVSTPTVKKASSGKVKVSWKNISGESGYQISKSTSKKKTSIVSTYSTTSGKSKTITAKKGKTYYYKVRAYKTVDGKKIYGPWSSVKSYKLS